MSKTVFLSIKRSLGIALRERIWYRKLRELALVCAVYNIKKAAEQEIPLLSGDCTRPIEHELAGKAFVFS